MRPVHSNPVERRTIHVDAETYRLLDEMSRESGVSLEETARSATEALWRRRLADMTVEQMRRLRSDPVAWEDYLAEAESTHVTDGIH